MSNAITFTSTGAIRFSFADHRPTNCAALAFRISYTAFRAEGIGPAINEADPRRATRKVLNGTTRYGALFEVLARHGFFFVEIATVEAGILEAFSPRHIAGLTEACAAPHK